MLLMYAFTTMGDAANWEINTKALSRGEVMLMRKVTTTMKQTVNGKYATAKYVANFFQEAS